VILLAPLPGHVSNHVSRSTAGVSTAARASPRTADHGIRSDRKAALPGGMAPFLNTSKRCASRRSQASHALREVRIRIDCNQKGPRRTRTIIIFFRTRETEAKKASASFTSSVSKPTRRRARPPRRPLHPAHRRTPLLELVTQRHQARRCRSWRPRRAVSGGPTVPETNESADHPELPARPRTSFVFAPSLVPGRPKPAKPRGSPLASQ
jgi:hypothetical protein